MGVWYVRGSSYEGRTPLHPYNPQHTIHLLERAEVHLLPQIKSPPAPPDNRAQPQPQRRQLPAGVEERERRCREGREEGGEDEEVGHEQAEEEETELVEVYGGGVCRRLGEHRDAEEDEREALPAVGEGGVEDEEGDGEEEAEEEEGLSVSWIG